MANEGGDFEVPDYAPLFNVQHPWLDFERLRITGLTSSKKADFTKRLNKMLPFPVYAHQAVDWDFLATMTPHDSDFDSAADELDSMLEVEYGEFISRAWSRLFRIHGPIYIEATYEFFSTFEYNPKEKNIHKVSVSFILGGQWRRLSIVEFGVALGLFDSDDQLDVNFGAHMKYGTKKVDATKILHVE